MHSIRLGKPPGCCRAVTSLQALVVCLPDCRDPQVWWSPPVFHPLSAPCRRPVTSVICGKGSDRVWTPRPCSVVVIEGPRDGGFLSAKENRGVNTLLLDTQLDTLIVGGGTQASPSVTT